LKEKKRPRKKMMKKTMKKGEIKDLALIFDWIVSTLPLILNQLRGFVCIFDMY